MTRYITGVDRSQATMFPDTLDDYIGEENSVRVIDIFVEELDLSAMGFEKAAPATTGRPAYHPSVLLKLYIYGYLNRIQSSRRLERETQRNIELMWLTGRLCPDFKTIADFRKDNGKAIQQACSQFVILCKQMEMFKGSAIVIDGSKFKAVNSKDRNYTISKLKARIAQTEERVARYMDELDRADRQPDQIPEIRLKHLRKRLKAARETLNRLEAIEPVIRETPDEQVSLTDPDARSIATSGKGTGIVGYNIQMAVEDKHHLIVAHEITNLGHDRTQLASMAEKAKQATDIENPKVYADRGYYSGNEILKCEEAGIDALVPKPITSNSKAHGRYEKRDFIYCEKTDTYTCPVGEVAKHRFTREEKGMVIRTYWSSACTDCRSRKERTTDKYRRIRRWEHEVILDRMQDRLDSNPDASRIRRQTVEHTFGTIKSWMGAVHFQMKTFKNVATEISLHVLAYNIKRMIAILGVKRLTKAIAT